MINGNQYENNYMNLMNTVEKSLEIEIIKKYCRKVFEWGPEKIKMMMEKREMNSIEQLIHSKYLSQSERMKV